MPAGARRPPTGPGGRPARPGPPRATWEAALPSPEALGPDEELVAGRRPVEEAFVARRPAIRLLVVPQRRAALERLVLHATNLRIPIVEVEGGSLTALAGFDGHQGIALVVEPRRYAGLDDVLARAAERGEPPFILVLDSLEDPHNVGSLLRSAEGAGVHGVLFPTHHQAPLSPSAIKASAGAVEHLLLCPVDDLPGALSDLHARGIRIAGADGEAPLTARESDLRGPLAIVVGSEGQGLGPAIRRRCDLFMRIPMRGAVGSLNAAVAGSILLFEAVSQRDQAGLAQVGNAVMSGHRAEPTAETEYEGPSVVDDTTVNAPKATKAPKPGKTTKTSKVAKGAKVDKGAKAPGTRKAGAAKAATGAVVAKEPTGAGVAKQPTDAGRATKARKPARGSAAAPEADTAVPTAPAGPDDDLLPAGGAVPRARRTRAARAGARPPATGGGHA